MPPIDEDGLKDVFEEFQMGEKKWFLIGTSRMENGFSVSISRLEDIEIDTIPGTISREITQDEARELMKSKYCTNATSAKQVMDALDELE